MSAPNGSQTVCERFVNQMLICVDETVNLRCAVCEWLAYHSPRTKICRLSARTQRELDAPGVVCSPQVRRKLINHAPLTRRMQMVQCVNGAACKRCACVYKALVWISSENCGKIKEILERFEKILGKF